jgi:hypothetical protein
MDVEPFLRAVLLIVGTVSILMILADALAKFVDEASGLRPPTSPAGGDEVS